MSNPVRRVWGGETVLTGDLKSPPPLWSWGCRRAPSRGPASFCWVLLWSSLGSRWLCPLKPMRLGRTGLPQLSPLLGFPDSVSLPPPFENIRGGAGRGPHGAAVWWGEKLVHLDLPGVGRGDSPKHLCLFCHLHFIYKIPASFSADRQKRFIYSKRYPLDRWAE